MKPTNTENQSGTVLFMCLVFLVLISLVSLGGIRSSIIELRLASNTEERLAAAHIAQAAIDAVIANEANFVVTGTVGTAKANVTYSGIDEILEFNQTDVVVTELGLSEPPRGSGLSSDKFSTASFSVDSAYDAVSLGRGQAHIAQGYMLIVSKNGQSNQ